MSLRILLLLVHPCVRVFRKNNSDETRSVEQFGLFRAAVETWWRLPCLGDPRYM